VPAQAQPEEMAAVLRGFATPDPDRTRSRLPQISATIHQILPAEMLVLLHREKIMAASKKAASKKKAAPTKKVTSKKKVASKKKTAKKTSDPCWDGYTQVGTKKKSGKTVPNCVPKK